VLEQSNFGKREGEGRERRQGTKERARHQVFLFEKRVPRGGKRASH